MSHITRKNSNRDDNYKPLGKQNYPVLIGRQKNKDVIIQTEEGYITIPAENAKDFITGFMLVIASE